MTTAAVIGCGDVSVVHLAAIDKLETGQLTAVCDTDPDTAAAAARRHRVPAFTDHRTLLGALQPDVAHICTPHNQHAQVAIDCLEAGVNVILEKPLAHTVADAEQIIDAADRHPEVKIGVCLQNRYNRTVQVVRALLESDDLGAVLGGAVTVLWHRSPDYYRARPWRGRSNCSGGGVLINQAIHSVDLMQWLLGDVTRVAGHAGKYGLGDLVDVEDTAQIVLYHRSGARTVFFATVLNAVDSPVTLEILTEKAVLFIRQDLTVTYGDGRVEVVRERRAGSAGRSYWGASHELLIADFYSKLDEPVPFWISPGEAIKSHRILAQVYALSRRD
jgi:UDP-N-acetyl-2-amino-2-deoxyglucuronate dehydrogenase